MNCKVCGYGLFDVYGKTVFNSARLELAQPEVRIEVDMTYVECSNCKTTIWGIAAEPHDYPYLKADRERWERKLAGGAKDEDDALLKELMQRAAGNEKFKDLIAGLMK